MNTRTPPLALQSQSAAWSMAGGPAIRRGLLLLAAGLVGAGSLLVDPYVAYVACSWVIFGLLGLSLDLVWGRGGLLSLGQTAFYGLGGYLGGVAAINLTGTGGSLIVALPVGAATGALVAGLVGWLIFYSRTGALQATILTYTLTLMLWTAAVSFKLTVGEAVIGGDNGLSEIPGYSLPGTGMLDPNGMFLTVLAVATVVLLLVQALMRAPFGTILSCIRMNPEKMELLGYDIRRPQLVAFAVSGSIAGLAGALYGGWSNYLSPSIFSPQEALLVPIYVLVGGRGTLAGSFVGALAVGALSFWLGGGVIGGQTTLIMGLCLIGLVLFLRRGLLGALEESLGAVSARLRPAAAPAPADPATPDTERLAAILRDARKGGKAGGETLRTEGALKRFGGVTPVNGVTQDFARGRVRCLIGPNGAGKSSFLRCCTGAYRVDAGRVRLGDRDITAEPTFRRAAAGIGIKMQVAQVFDELDVRTNLWVAAYRDGNAHTAWQRAGEMLGLLGLSARADAIAGDLSHGEQQWLDIAMVLCSAPAVILLDEPAAGMTGEETRRLSALIRALARDAAVVVVEHDMEFIRTLDADVTVLHQGAVFAQGDIEGLRQDERILDIYLGKRKHVRDL